MKRNADESELSQFERDVKSLRQQSLESIQESFLKYAPDSVENADDARRFFAANCFASSMVRNKVDPIYPRDDDGGEVVAMGTEDTMACGLLKDQDEERLFGKHSTE
jgi:hypothetical protein